MNKSKSEIKTIIDKVLLLFLGNDKTPGDMFKSVFNLSKDGSINSDFGDIGDIDINIEIVEFDTNKYNRNNICYFEYPLMGRLYDWEIDLFNFGNLFSFKKYNDNFTKKRYLLLIEIDGKTYNMFGEELCYYRITGYKYMNNDKFKSACKNITIRYHRKQKFKILLDEK